MDRLIISKALDELDVDYLACATVEEFLPQVKEYTPDLCLVDLNIQRTNDGAILIEAIRKVMGKSLPIIVISANDNSNDILEILKNGANDFICKPIDKPLLSSKIANYLTNDLIKSKTLPLFMVPESSDNYIEINTNIEIQVICETGIEFTCRDLNLNIGSTVKVENKLLLDIFPNQEFLYLKITESADGVFYSTFQELTSDEQNHLRLLIVSKR
jgi:CheY-like chemotaxis protein